MMLNESRRSRAHFDLPLALMVFGLAGIGLVLNVIKNRSVTMMPGIAPQTMSARKWMK